MEEMKPIVALIYDFDGTLSPGNMQEYSFIEAVGLDKDDFWEETRRMAEKQDSDNILIYMLLMLEKAKEMHLPVRRENFQKYGESVEWFKLINDYGEKHGVIVEHYINSSGMKEIIEGTSIANEFKTIFACAYYYDEN